EFLFATGFADVVKQDLATGQHRNPEDRPHWFTTAFFHHPDELRREAEEAGLRIENLVGLEGLAGYLLDLGDHSTSTEERELSLWSARAVETEPALLGLSAHLLLVATTPGR